MNSRGKTLTRKSALGRLAAMQAMQLSLEDRESELSEWWSIGPDEPAWMDLPESLRAEMEQEPSPVLGAMSARYLPLITVACRARLRGATNEWISAKIFELGGYSFRVMGDIEPMEACPCCRYRTLSQRGAYEICPVCFWEDDGSSLPEQFSGPNHMTVMEGQLNFAHFGSCSKQERKYIDTDVLEKYERIP